MYIVLEHRLLAFLLSLLLPQRMTLDLVLAAILGIQTFAVLRRLRIVLLLHREREPILEFALESALGHYFLQQFLLFSE